MSTKAIYNITVLALDNWAQPVAWPRDHRFYAACIVDRESWHANEGGVGAHDVMKAAMLAGAKAYSGGVLERMRMPGYA